MSLDLGVNGNTFARVSNALSLNVAVQLRNNDAVQDPLKQIVEAAWQTVLMGATFESPHAISVSGLTIVSPAGNAAGRIDHFAGLSFVLKLVDAKAILPESVASLMSAANPTLQGADIATLEGQALRLTPTLGLNNPLALSTSIAWASGDIVLGVTLARGPNTLSPSLTLRCGGTTDVAKDTLEQMVTDIMSEWRVKSRVEAITIISKAVLPLPLQTVNLQPIVQPVLDSGTSSINPKLQSVSLRTLPDSSVSMGIAAELTNPLPFSATIGWLSLDAFLDGAALGKITIAPFNLGHGRTALRTQITINGARGSGAAEKMAQFVETFLSGGELRFRVGDVITSFQRVRADVPLEKMLKGTRAPIDLASLVTSRLVGAVDAIAGGASSITIPLLPGMSIVDGQVGIDVQSGKKVGVSTSMRLNADFDIDVQVGHFAATALLNNVRMVTASLSDLKLKQNTDVSLGVSLAFADDVPIQDEVAGLVAKLFDERIPGTLQLGQIAVGTSPTDTLDLLSAVKVGLPIEPIAKPIVGKVKSVAESILNNVANNRDLVTLGDNAITITLSPSVSVVVRDVSVATAPQKTLSISVRSDVKTPLPLSINLPFVGAGLTVNGQRLVTLGLRGLSLKNGGAAGLSLTADLRFDGPQSAADELAGLVGVLMRGKSLKGTAVGVQSPVFGVSFEDTINTFARVNLGVDAGLFDNVIKSVRGLVDKVLGSINPRLINNGAKGFTLQLADNLAVDVNSVDVRTQQGKTIAVEVDANLRLPIKVRVNIGHVGVALSLNGAQLVAFETGIQLGDRLNKMTVVLRDFGESDESQTQIAQLVSAVLGRQSPLPGNFGVSQAVLGVSRDDVIDAFRAVSIQLPVQTLAAPVLALLPANFDIVDIATQLGFQLGAVDVKALPDRRISAGIQVTLNNPMPVSVSMGYVSVSIGSDGIDLVSVAVNDLKLTSNGRNSLTLNVELSFADSEAAQDKLAALVRDPKSISFGGIRFGASPAEPIALLAKTRVEVPMSLVNNDKFITFALKQVGLTKDDLALESLIKRIALGNMNVAVKSAVEVDGSVSIALPVSISVDLPVIALVAYSEQGRINASFRARLDMAATEPAQVTVANLINKFLSGETKLQLGAGVGSVLFGASENPKDIVMLARKVRIDVDVSPVVAYFRGMLPAKLDIVEIAQRFGVQMGKVAVKGQPGAKVDAEIVTVEVGQLSLRASARNTLSLNIGATFRNTQAAQDAVVAFLKNPTAVFLTGVRFGASPNDNIRLLAKAKLIAPAALDASIALPVDVSVHCRTRRRCLSGCCPLAGVSVRDIVVGAREGGRMAWRAESPGSERVDPTQDKVSDLVNQLVANKNITLSAGVDSVPLVRLDLNVTPMIGQVKSVLMDFANKWQEWLVIENVTTGLIDTTTMSGEATVDISKLPLVGRISMKLQYATLDAYVNGVPIVSPRVTSFSLVKGKLRAAVALPFAQGPDTVKELGAIADQAGNLIFFNPPTKRAINVVVELAGKVNVNMDVTPYFEQATEWYNRASPFSVSDIQATLSRPGIEVDVKINLGPLKAIPIVMNIPSVSARIYDRGFGDKVMVENWVNNVKITDGVLYFRLIIDPVFPAVMDGLNDAVPRLASWKDLAENAFLGGFALHTVPDAKKATPQQTMSTFIGARLDVPPLFFYRPLTLRPILINPFKEGVGIDLEVSFDNPGPLHINIGQLHWIGKLGGDKLVLINKQEGPRNVFRLKTRLTLNLLDIPGLLWDLVAHRDRFGFKSDIRWEPNTELVWLNQIVERLPPALVAHIWEILLGLIRNSSVRLFKEEGAKLAAATNATTVATVGSNSTAPALSRRWLSRRAAVDETITKIEVSKWQNEPVVPPELQDLIKIDWSALSVATTA
ncbi:hypothetical protein BCR44DRAFT_1455777 [Catenaria anguillulae PL171]|uniref:Uncharacterized protein n=1 Tax=Catenaria anguillulae PL171 TaxID=765915 RepID=A0A1Y2GY14_9FUNG|nr:hypothetical protein BCR44DRAFT_1455777 [Catenaria anguillulae PL171]